MGIPQAQVLAEPLGRVLKQGQGRDRPARGQPRIPLRRFFGFHFPQGAEGLPIRFRGRKEYPSFFTEFLDQALRAQGVAVGGAPRVGELPEGACKLRG